MLNKKRLKIVLGFFFILALLVMATIAGEYHGYLRGYKKGEQVTNTWWIDKKSHYFESSEVIKKGKSKKHHHI